MDNRTKETIFTCSSLWPLDMPQIHMTAWAILTAVLSPITIVSNLTLIYLLHKTKQLTTNTNKFILAMSLSDLSTGIFVLPGIVVMIVTRNKLRNCSFELTMQYLAFVLAYFSFFMLVSVSIDRYLNITKPHRYKDFVTDARIKIVVLVFFAVSCAVAAVSVTTPSFVLQVLLNISDLSGVLFMCILYVFVFHKITQHTENIQKYLCETGAKNTRRAARREVSATKTIRILLVALLVLYFPYNISSAVWAYYKYKLKQPPGLVMDVLEYLSYVIVFANASANAIIFGLGNPKTRRYMKRRLCHSLKRETTTVSMDALASDGVSDVSTTTKNNCQERRKEEND